MEPAGNQWRVLAGLKAGERLIVQGQLKAKPGKAVRPVVVEAGRQRGDPRSVNRT